MSISMLIFIFFIILIIGLATVKSLIKKTTVTVVETVNNGVEILYYASKSARDASLVYLAENSVESNKKLQNLKNKNPEWFDLDSKL